MDLSTIAGRYPLLTWEEEILLSRQIQAWIAIRDQPPTTNTARRIWRSGRHARDRMVLHNLRFAIAQARRTLRLCRTLTADDLQQAAALGLITAAERFDPAAGYRFVTYAFWWIRTNMHRHVNEADAAIRIPAYMYEIRPKLQKALDSGMTFDDAVKLNKGSRQKLGAETIRAALPMMRHLVSLDSPIEEQKDYYEVVADDAPDMLEQISNEDTYDLLRLHVSRLSERHRTLIEAFYNLDGSQEQPNLTQYGHSTGVSRQAASQMHQAALNQLRRNIALSPIAP